MRFWRHIWTEIDTSDIVFSVLFLAISIFGAIYLIITREDAGVLILPGLVVYATLAALRMRYGIQKRQSELFEKPVKSR